MKTENIFLNKTDPKKNRRSSPTQGKVTFFSFIERLQNFQIIKIFLYDFCLITRAKQL